MIPLDEADSGYYWVQLYNGAGDLYQISVPRNKWVIVRIDRTANGYVHFPKENNYGRSSCTMKHFKERVGINVSPLFKIEKPD